ncbi:MAG: polysaccharide biosynthesis/export family protein [Gemmatales bacterium]|nr:polysaccharide biosynthesis/export family protein [Gemmatales bacterium]MDW8176503.1 polysaccharide biosynthesis/export family protein [Gemmatales bacterium]
MAGNARDFVRPLTITAAVLLAGCCDLHRGGEIYLPEMPRELQKVTMPPYIIEPPDILLIDAVRVIPLPPYRIEPLDILLIQAAGTLPDEPIAGLYRVEPDGTIPLGAHYGSVRVVGQTLEEARLTIEAHLRKILKDPKVTVTLAESRALQQIRGEHLVRPDGTIALGTYGSVYVAGMTLDQAKVAIERYLAQFLQNPEVSVDVLAYNSKVYYVIFDGGGYGQQIIPLPVTGNETVLDALAKVNGLPFQASKQHIWIARPAPPEAGGEQILPVNWDAITRKGSTATNYQILPGDRIYVQADRWITLDNTLAKILTPFERIFGFTLLGNATIRAVSNGNNTSTGTGF